MPALTSEPNLREVVRNLRCSDTAQRLAALDRFTAAPMPSPQQEIWRYSRIAELDLDRFAYGELSTTVSGAGDVQVDDVPIDTDDELDLFADLNRALSTVVHLRVPRGRIVEQPIVITHELNTAGAVSYTHLTLPTIYSV